jgi:hypothetical protein
VVEPDPAAETVEPVADPEPAAEMVEPVADLVAPAPDAVELNGAADRVADPLEVPVEPAPRKTVPRSNRPLRATGAPRANRPLRAQPLKPASKDQDDTEDEERPKRTAASVKTAPASTARVADSADTTAAWVEPDGTACPPTHLIKAKLSSGIFHLPGMLAYERTKPDRCYATEEAAVADGFTKAKR